MSSRGCFHIVRRLPRFQFSLGSLLAFTTLVAIVFGLVKWHRDLGGIASIVIIGVWFTAVAISAYWRRVAYFLTAFGCGVIWYVALALPISVSGLVFSEIPFPARPWYSLDLETALCCCLASMLAATIVRPWVVDSTEISFSSIVSLTYLTSILSFCAVTVCMARENSHGEKFILMMASPAVITASLYVLIPAGIAAQTLLQNVERMAVDLAWTERRILDAVGVLEVFDAGPITCKEIARRAGEDRKTTAAFLERLCNSGQLSWTEERGYRLVRIGRPRAARSDAMDRGCGAREFEV